MKLTIEEKDFLIGALSHIKEEIDISAAMEYGETINDILDKLQNE